MKASTNTRDKDGFLVLARISDADPKADPKPKHKTKKHKDKDKPKKPKITFKKGGWKWSLWRKIRDWRTSKYVHKFHSERCRTYAVYYPKDQQQVPYGIVAKGGLCDSELSYLLKIANSPIIFVPTGSDTYTGITPKTYKKLQTIEKVAIYFKLMAYDDDPAEPPRDIDEFEDVFDNMNSLLSFIEYHRQMVLGVYELQARWCWGPSHEFEFKVMVYKKNGKIDTYTNLNDFLMDYHLHTV